MRIRKEITALVLGSAVILALGPAFAQTAQPSKKTKKTTAVGAETPAEAAPGDQKPVDPAAQATAPAPAKDLSETTEPSGKVSGKQLAPAPHFLHRPPSTALPGREIKIRGKILPEGHDRRVVLRYRSASGGDWRESEMRWSATGELVVDVPAEDVEPPGVEYYLAVLPPRAPGEPEAQAAQKLDPPRVLLFASAEKPHLVIVHGYSTRTLRAKRKAEHGDRLSRLETRYGYSDFGLQRKPRPSGSGLPVSVGGNDDSDYYKTDQGNFYHEISLAYTYRFLTYLYALRVDIGMLVEHFEDFRLFSEEGIEAGMLYMAPSTEFELHKYFGASLLVRLAVTEEGFQGGGGTSFRIGRINGTRLDFGGEGLSYVGWRFFLRFGWDTVPYVPMAVLIEATEWYAHEDWANRMLYELTWNVAGGFSLTAHVGYAARAKTVEGGLVAGGSLMVDF